MDQHQQQSQPMHDDSSQNFVASQYAMYSSSEDDTAGYLVYPQMQQTGYPPVVHNPGAPPRGFLQSAYCSPNRDLTCPFPSFLLSPRRPNVRQRPAASGDAVSSFNAYVASPKPALWPCRTRRIHRLPASWCYATLRVPSPAVPKYV